MNKHYPNANSEWRYSKRTSLEIAGTWPEWKRKILTQMIEGGDRG